jgi:FdhD protein
LVDQIHGKTNSNFQQLSHAELKQALDGMREDMTLFRSTGGCHGAALLDPLGNVLCVSEDIGRHNAVDKTVGSAIYSGINAFNEYTLLLSGRCGWDIVAKATRIGIPSIASVGAFSSAALDLARENGISLYGFVRESGAWKAGIN